MAATDSKFQFALPSAILATVEMHIGASITNPFVANPLPPVDAPNVDPQNSTSVSSLSGTFAGVRFAIPA